VPHIEECFIDSLHPNAYGCELMAQGIADFMKKIKF
jgi:lysophospholipase L1-like esterase